MVLVISGISQAELEVNNDQWQQLAREMRTQCLSVKDIASELSDNFNLNKNKVKDYLNNLQI